ncbi:MAG: MerR family transcriptional regulator [Acidimicrobiales bacterium]
MSARSYLSIGDVLSLLRQEFPDVTISKIRFLESQGLVNPERTPSGYRKFYGHDVDRLRWVLRQQREHFLPLKVIKDRLEDGVDPETVPGPLGEHEVPNGPGPADDGDLVFEEPILVGGSGPLTEMTSRTARSGRGTSAGNGGVAQHRAGAAVPAGGTRSTTAPDSGSGRPMAATSAGPRRPDGRSGSQGIPAPVRGPATGAAGTGSRAGGREVRLSEPGSQPAAAEAAASPRGQRPEGGGSTEPGGGSTEPGARVPSAPAGPPAGRQRRDQAPPAPPPGGANLSADELAADAGIEVSMLRELQSFGLLHSTRVAGVEYFNEEALSVAVAAAGFARFGVEARHLRLYKNAADREAGFVEQIVLPLVRQRNPQARVRAQESADELARLGQQLRASLLRAALGDLLSS